MIRHERYNHVMTVYKDMPLPNAEKIDVTLMKSAQQHAMRVTR